ncbi:MAG: hypothetical protein ACE5LU_13665 [Anaerolineae bacterium]
MTRRKWSILILLTLMLLLIGQAVYAQGETQTANLQIGGMV